MKGIRDLKKYIKGVLLIGAGVLAIQDASWFVVMFMCGCVYYAMDIDGIRSEN